MKRNLMMLFVFFLMVDGASAGNIAIPSPNRVVVPNHAHVPGKAVVPQTVLVPNLLGMQHAQAVSRLEQLGLQEDERELSTNGEGCVDEPGKVLRQQPAAGTRVTVNSSVRMGWCR